MAKVIALFVTGTAIALFLGLALEWLKWNAKAGVLGGWPLTIAGYVLFGIAGYTTYICSREAGSQWRKGSRVPLQTLLPYTLGLVSGVVVLAVQRGVHKAWGPLSPILLLIALGFVAGRLGFT